MGRSGLLVGGSVLTVTAACVSVLLYLRRRRRRSCLHDAVETDEVGSRSSRRVTEAADQTYALSPEKCGTIKSHSDKKLDSWERWHYSPEKQEVEGKATAREFTQAPRAPFPHGGVDQVLAPRRREEKLCSQTEERQQKLTAQALAVHESNNRGVFTSDGTEVQDPRRYIAAMQETGGYQGGLFDSTGAELRDPLAYISTQPGTNKHLAMADSTLYTADGEKVRDPSKYVRAMQKAGGYKGGLYNSKGEEVWRPDADASSRVSSLRGTSHAGTSVRQTVKSVASPQQRSSTSRKNELHPSTQRRNNALFKADGSVVRDPVRYVASMQSTGGYRGGLYNAKGEEIWDPVAYVDGMKGRWKGHESVLPVGAQRSEGYSRSRGTGRQNAASGRSTSHWY
eukprot:TRINITY_DN102402_c0_g1_i1.p1 TRINITY_DN102402_c0_g1~~TRINITY_DN102402_c0_g1_i1.p1  ORF type:complete len:405 (+),score=46.82 TRINITY_DN102402_c0_g1_i1:30-1217(+)